MPEYRENRTATSSRHRVQSQVIMLALALLLVAHPGFAQSAPDAAAEAADLSNELSLDQFRSLVSARLSQISRVSDKKSRGPQPTVDLREADEVFFQLLMIQAKDAAAHQSVDRLSGWRKAVELRLQTQTAPELDVEIIRFSEAKMTAESARIEFEQKRLIARANLLLGRPANTPLVALLPPSVGEEASAVQNQAKEVLTQGEEAVAKIYKNYQFGGISVIELIELEGIVYEFELEYRQALARDAMEQRASEGLAQ